MAATYEHVIYERRGRISYLTMNRPEVLNAINGKMREEIEAAKTEFAADPEALVLIMTGAGDRGFCSGADLKEPRRENDAGTQPVTRDVDARFTVPIWKPMIAAVNGWAVGGGLAYALACDIRIASEAAHFAFSEARVGVAGGGIDNWLFPRTVPLGEALYYLLTAESLDAAEAHRIGLVHEVLPDREQLLARAEEIAERIAANHPLAVRAIKEAVNVGLSQSFEMSQRTTNHLSRAVRESEDAAEARSAFVEKRAPVFKGR